MSLEIKLAYDDVTNMKKLFLEYISLLGELENDLKIYFDIHKYDIENENLNEKYGLPNNRLYIAYFDNQAAGCIALNQINENECEIKQLYIRPQFRNKGIARALTELIIHDAKQIGYKYILLETMPALKTARKLYEDMGFYIIPSYSNNTLNNMISMKLDLL
jgi:ribosomal protein S18 acetylase RimI-like enzyme